MIYEMPCPTPELMLVASSREEAEPAETEIAQWADQNGYQFAQNARMFVFYRNGAQARTWRLIERAPMAVGTEH
jgi:hypothetical protein